MLDSYNQITIYCYVEYFALECQELFNEITPFLYFYILTQDNLSLK